MAKLCDTLSPSATVERKNSLSRKLLGIPAEFTTGAVVLLAVLLHFFGCRRGEAVVVHLRFNYTKFECKKSQQKVYLKGDNNVTMLAECNTYSKLQNLVEKLTIFRATESRLSAGGVGPNAAD